MKTPLLYIPRVRLGAIFTHSSGLRCLPCGTQDFYHLVESSLTSRTNLLGTSMAMTMPQRWQMISVSQVEKVLEKLPLQSRILITPTMQAEKNWSSLFKHQAIQSFSTGHHGPFSSIYSKRNERSTPWVTFSNNCNKGHPKNCPRFRRSETLKIRRPPHLSISKRSRGHFQAKKSSEQNKDSSLQRPCNFF